MKRFVLLCAFAALFAACAPKAQEPRVMARFVPERADDFVFENNLVAGRFYGKALEGNPTSPGIDVWVKLPGALVANDWYAKAVSEDPDYYHHNHGGKDCYKVAVSLGGGASAPYLDEQICYPATNFRSSEVLYSSPDSVVFVLHYPEWEASPGVRVALDKQVTVVADSYFVRVDDRYTFAGVDSLPVVAGMKLHGNAVFAKEGGEAAESSLLLQDRIAIWEKASDTSIEPEDGMLGIAVVMPGAETAVLRPDLDHLLLIKCVPSGEPLTYWFGSCWSKGDIKTWPAWFGLVKSL